MSDLVSRRALLRGAGAAGLALSAAALTGGRALAQERPSVRLDCPILTYHEVPSRTTFARQITGYLERGYQPITLRQLYALLLGEDVPLGGKPFVITLDDGLRSQKENALPFLAEWQLPAAFAAMPNWRGDGVHRYMSDDDLRMLVQDYGLEVISHTLDHAQLVRLRTRNFGSWQAEIVNSKLRLKEIVGDDYDVPGFCYPFGAFDAATIALVSQYYPLALSTRPGTVQRTEELYQLRRTSMT